MGTPAFSSPEGGLNHGHQAAQVIAMTDGPGQPELQPGKKIGSARWSGDGRRKTQQNWAKKGSGRGSRVGKGGGTIDAKPPLV
ncbi:hypothetical protein MY11210_008568 [Beauveria gryllotalpidicola]